MTAAEQLALRQLAEHFRRRAAAIELKHAKTTWVQSINVVEAFEQCAQDVEALCAPPPAANTSSECRLLEPKPPEQTANAS
jgi:hypothetical protein